MEIFLCKQLQRTKLQLAKDVLHMYDVYLTIFFYCNTSKRLCGYVIRTHSLKWKKEKGIDNFWFYCTY